MAKKINFGSVNGNTYIKHIDFHKAVIWKDREISLHWKVVEEWFPQIPILDICFLDKKHGKRYSVSVEEAQKHWHYSQVGQEKQYYFPIEILEIEDLKR